MAKVSFFTQDHLEIRNKGVRIPAHPYTRFYLRLIEVTIDELGQRSNRLFLIDAVSDDRDGSTLYDAKGQNAEQALGVNAPFFLLDPDAALEFIRLLNEEGCGSGVKTYLIVDNDLFGYHVSPLLITYEIP